MVNYKDIENCCGCSACEVVCPNKAIVMKEDGKGFLHPAINVDKCINCGLCEKVCDFKKFKPIGCPTKTFAVKHVNAQEINSSQSGAAFMALCDYVLNKNGYVCGCAMVDKNTVAHIVENSKEGINKFKGSKYVQSTMRDSFSKCIELLQKDNYVLFSGTPCQVHGFLSLCEIKKINIEKLITCDLICHGCPSIKVWNAFINEIEKRNKKIVNKVNFRNKNEFGWHSHVETLIFDDGNSISTSRWKDNFYDHSMFRESCYNCKYTTIYRKSDFTIGDCWGIEKVAPEFDDNKGTSIMIVRTTKANDVFKDISEYIISKEININDVIQPQLQQPVNKGRNYNRFWSLFLKNERKAIKIFFFPSRIRILFRKIKTFLRIIFKTN